MFDESTLVRSLALIMANKVRGVYCMSAPVGTRSAATAALQAVDDPLAARASPRSPRRRNDEPRVCLAVSIMDVLPGCRWIAGVLQYDAISRTMWSARAAVVRPSKPARPPTASGCTARVVTRTTFSPGGQAELGLRVARQAAGQQAAVLGQQHHHAIAGAGRLEHARRA